MQKTGTVLRRPVINERILELEISLIEEHGLVLSPAAYPWDQFARRDPIPGRFVRSCGPQGLRSDRTPVHG